MNYTSVLQHSEEDCGAACLATIAKHYGRTFSMNRVREAVGTGQLGTTLLGLRRGAETLGFNAQAVKASPELVDRMNEVPLPAVIHWKGVHWVVLYGQKRRHYVIADPGIGIRFVRRQELDAAWSNGVMLLLEPDESRFYAQTSDEVRGFGRFLRKVQLYRGLLLEALALNLLLGLLSLALPLVIQVLTDDVLTQGDTQLLKTVVIAASTLIGFSAALGFIQSTLIVHFAQRLELGLMLEFGRKLLRLPLTYFESHRSGEIVSRLRDIREINFLVAQVVISLPTQALIALVSLAVMLAYSPTLTGLALLISFVMSLPTLLMLPALRRKTRDVLVTASENQGILVETFKGALTLKTTNAHPQIWDDLQHRFGRLANLTLGTVRIGIITSVLSTLVLGLGTLAILGMGSRFVIQGSLSVGQLLAFNSMNLNFTSFIQQAIAFADEFARAQTATQRLGDIIHATPESPDDEAKPYATLSSQADIICTDLCFHHAGRVNLFEHFSVTIPGGQFTAVIGQSGCGKSSLAKAIAGLYQPQSGNIRFGSFNQGDLSLECLRQQVILVPQEPHFWSRSILENFQLSYPQASFEAIVVACQVSGADEFISQLPDRYHTVLGEFGANLSGGQKQRLAIARAIVSDPPILILDESTGALDPSSETQVLTQLLEVRQHKTTIAISHRPRVIQQAEWIVLLEKGRLKLTGSPTDLKQKLGDHLVFLIP
ncbi:MAG: peptidase domain-containing ABC transporter [Cyanobacteria bacterium P01_D01_bin.123]